MSAVAHGGGAPEAATLVLPLLPFVVLLLLERRARRRNRTPGADQDRTERQGAADPPRS